MSRYEAADFHPETAHLHDCGGSGDCLCRHHLFAVAQDAETRLEQVWALCDLLRSRGRDGVRLSDVEAALGEPGSDSGVQGGAKLQGNSGSDSTRTDVGPVIDVSPGAFMEVVEDARPDDWKQP